MSNRTILNIDNHRQDEFASFSHNPEPIVTAEMLLDRLHGKIRDAKAEREARTNTLSSLFNQAVSESSSSSGPTEAQIDQINNNWATYKHPEYMRKYSGEVIEFPEKAEKFHERARWQRTPKAADITEDWMALQESIEPSLLDEDCLGGLDEWMANTPKDTQYILFGDTNHNHKKIRDWCLSGDFLSLLIENDIQDLVVEAPIEFKNVVYDYLSGDISEAVMTDQLGHQWAGLATFVRAAKNYGITVHCLDRQLTSRPDLNSPRFCYERIAREDELLAERIQDAVQDRKAVIVYGEAHFAYNSSLHEQLGLKKCRHINLHADLANYKNDDISTNAKHIAPYAYLIDEGAVVATRGRYRRNIPANKDPFNIFIMMGKQEEEIKKYLERVEQKYGQDKSTLWGVNQLSVLDDVYWFQEALKCGFTTLDDIIPQTPHRGQPQSGHPGLPA